MLLNKRALAVRHAASKDETRINLCTVLLEPDGRTIATDGHVLITAKVPVPDEQNFPGNESLEDANPPKLEEPVMLPRESVEALAKSVPREPKTGGHRDALKARGCARLDTAETNANGHARFYTTDRDGENLARMDVRKVVGEFPDWRQVIPKGEEAAVSFGINLLLLERVVKAAKEWQSSNRGLTCRVDVKGPLSPILFSLENEDDGEFQGVVMPMRL